ncbi:transposase [Bacillus thuringiensis]|uniref:helix-turn-helix domain-containing protein n=1 Tax=Bacillus thuringiensis TaxID=1428 RepID=UPI000C9E8727|nr:helix-turn-helix domain-containing protein [Bacillus thuringiensis]PNK22960.1 transposase [Bacillus thuringiensis]PNK47112.1 transposase [Bacillus thuringiensis]
MGKFRVTFGMEFKINAVDLYIKEGMDYKTVAKEFGISLSIVRRWIRQYKTEGLKGLEEKRGKAKGPNKGRPRTKPEDLEAKMGVFAHPLEKEE